MSLIFFFLPLCRQDLVVIPSSLNSIGHIKTEQNKKAWTENLDGRRGGKVSENSMKATAVSSRLRSDSIRSFKRNSCHHKLPFHARFLRLPLFAPSQRLPTAPINLQATPCSPLSQLPPATAVPKQKAASPRKVVEKMWTNFWFATLWEWVYCHCLSANV